jgi:hypothetical protein
MKAAVIRVGDTVTFVRPIPEYSETDVKLILYGGQMRHRLPAGGISA